MEFLPLPTPLKEFTSISSALGSLDFPETTFISVFRSAGNSSRAMFSDTGNNGSMTVYLPCPREMELCC